MESKFKQFINNNKGFLVFYLIWFLFHLIFISTGIDGGGERGLWPFGDKDYNNSHYNFKDLLFYLIVPIVIWGIWKLIGRDINNKIEKNN